VGAGPAGSVAALYCAKHGLNTALIERTNKIGAHTNTRIDSFECVTVSKPIKNGCTLLLDVSVEAVKKEGIRIVKVVDQSLLTIHRLKVE